MFLVANLDANDIAWMVCAVHMVWSVGTYYHQIRSARVEDRRESYESADGPLESTNGPLDIPGMRL